MITKIRESYESRGMHLRPLCSRWASKTLLKIGEVYVFLEMLMKPKALNAIGAPRGTARPGRVHGRGRPCHKLRDEKVFGS